MNDVTVLIPCYNQVKYINNSIDSALNQGARVIVYDDKSTDGSRELLKFRGDIELILGDENSGTAVKPYNIMFGWCDTDFMIPLSADDMLAPGAVRLMRSHMDHLDWLYPNTYLIDEDGIVKGSWEYSNFPRDYDGMKEFIRLNNSSPAPWMGMFRMSFIKDNNLKMTGFKSVKNGEDLRTIIDWIEYKPRVGHIPAYLYFYRRHPGARTYGLMGNENLDYKKEITELLGVRDD